MDEETIYLEVRTTQSKLSVCQAARTRAYLEGKLLETARQLLEEPGYIAQEFTLDLDEGQTVTLEKVVALYTSRDRAVSEMQPAGERSRQAMRRFYQASEKPHSGLGTFVAPLCYRL